jgi:hypothetical protein
MVLLVRSPTSTLPDIVLVRLHSIPHVRTTHTNFVLDEQRLPCRSRPTTRTFCALIHPDPEERLVIGRSDRFPVRY